MLTIHCFHFRFNSLIASYKAAQNDLDNLQLTRRYELKISKFHTEKNHVILTNPLGQKFAIANHDFELLINAIRVVAPSQRNIVGEFSVCCFSAVQKWFKWYIIRNGVNFLFVFILNGVYLLCAVVELWILKLKLESLKSANAFLHWKILFDENHVCILNIFFIRIYFPLQNNHTSKLD